MPELPDVEIFRRYLDTTALDQKIARVSVQNRMVLRRIAPQTLARNLRGRKLRSSRRHGKFLYRVPKSWLLRHRAKGAKCPHCGKGIDRLTISQRSAYICPNCQRRKF